MDEAICFGWIDSTKKTIDDERYMQYFSKRKPNSTWSKVNKDKVTMLIKKKRMRKSGLETIDVAKQNGLEFDLKKLQKALTELVGLCHSNADKNTCPVIDSLQPNSK
mgnify:CR=1 FL=1